MKVKNNYKAITNFNSLHILFKSIIIGLLVGIVIAAYRLALSNAEELCFHIYSYIRNNLIIIPLMFLVLGGLGYLVGILVSKFRLISGSGIPQVKGIIMGYFKNNWLSTMTAKFFGGAISILAGLSLGREGPSIQFGACVGEGIADKFAESRTEKKVLIASGASAGLAAAFNAPLSGAVFAMEEIFKYFSPIILLSSMASAIVADYVSGIIFGVEPIFSFHLKNNIPLSGYWLVFILGAVLGVAGAFYNYALIYTQKLYKKMKWLNANARPIVPFIFAGMLGVLFPLVLGSGHSILGELNMSTGIIFLILILIIKFIFTMISFGSGAPGGIFFPLLVIGATIGAIFGNVAVNYLGIDQSLYYNFIVLAMAGYFTAIVRAPITGIILLVEMTGSFTQLLALTVVSLVAYVVADLLKSAPIYESLLEKQIADFEIETNEVDHSKRVVVEMIVHHWSESDRKLVREIEFPKNGLLISIKRRGKEIIPSGNTEILPEDYLVFLTNISDEALTREKLTEITTAF